MRPLLLLHQCAPAIIQSALTSRWTTLAERSRAIPIVTVEHGVAFAIHHDSTNPNGSYSAEVWILKGPINPVRPSDPERKQPRPSFAPVLVA
jgi:hypothetical protein